MVPSRLLAVAGLGVLAVAGAPACAQDKFPLKPIRIVTAQELGNRIGQRVVVENRGSIAIEYVAKEAQPDGHTLLFYGGTVWLQPFLNKLGWDPVTDLAPITLAVKEVNRPSPFT